MLGSRATVRRSSVDRLLLAVAAAVLVGFCAIFADAVVRDGWHGVSKLQHAVGSIGLYTPVAASIGLLAGIVALLAARIERRTRLRWPRAASALLPLSAALAGGYFFADTIAGTFTGMGVRDSALARWGPPLMLAATALGCGGLAWCVRSGVRSVDRGKIVKPLIFGALLLTAAAAFAAVDLTIFVALYSRLHEMLETIAAMVALSALVILIALARSRLPRARVPIMTFGALSLLWLTLFTASARLRGGVDHRLEHVWHEPAYLGRMLMRVQLAEAFLRDPKGWRGARASRLARFKQRFDIGDVALSPLWTKRNEESREQRHALADMRAHTGEFNIVVFYVDTLRRDIAFDGTTMPNTMAFAKKSLDFERAYTFASDTENALPVIINGSYFEDQENGNLMERARVKGMSTALFIAKSARRFVTELVPSFTFEHTIDVIDYEQSRTVWGYGADRPSAVDVVDEALAWIDGRTSERFFAWLFHFDVHNWRQLNDDYVETMARQAGIDEPDLRKRAYRGAAAGVDLALARFLKGLKDRQLDERTIIMFLSDHGEALGQQGHWQHAVFLWESLVRVPLMLYVPGVAPESIPSPVGHADIAPTLARFFDAQADVASYHGHDLLRHALPGSHHDGLPLLLQSMRKDDVLRVGIIERRPPYHKLVLPLDSAEPELCDLTAADPDNANVAREQHRLMLDMLSKLVRSPVFPRGEEEAEAAEGERTAAR